jgi:hypothetical protein
MLACALLIVPQLARAQAGSMTRAIGGDSSDANYVRAGFGSLRQDDLTVHLTLTGGLEVRAIPFEESLIRLLSPDSYNTMRLIKASRKIAVDSIMNRNRLQKVSLWYVQFYGLEQGEARFSPQDLIVRNVGRDFRAIQILGLTTGFGDNRVKQREVQSALYVFDGQLDVYQTLTIQMGNVTSSTDWDAVLRRAEQERSSVRSRSAGTPQLQQ